jgi:hypothetical protein
MLNLEDSCISGVGISMLGGGGGGLFAVREKITTVVEEIF